MLVKVRLSIPVAYSSQLIPASLFQPAYSSQLIPARQHNIAMQADYQTRSAYICA
jgi:hypothetical protein